MENENTHIYYAMSLSEVLDCLMKQNYCLILLKLPLSQIKGLEMLRIIRLTKSIPILVLAPELSCEETIAIFQAGADAIIKKPINIDICVAQAQALIHRYLSEVHREPELGSIEQVTYGTDIAIIPHFRQVLIDGKQVSLTRKEFDLLSYFAHHPRQVFSLEQLYTQVWNDKFAITGEETVRVHIQTLRKKLAREGKHFIQNVWGVGYKFEPPDR